MNFVNYWIFIFLLCTRSYFAKVSTGCTVLLCICSYFAHVPSLRKFPLCSANVPTLHMFYSVCFTLTLLMYQLGQTMHKNLSMDKDCNRAMAKFIKDCRCIRPVLICQVWWGTQKGTCCCCWELESKAAEQVFNSWDMCKNFGKTFFKRKMYFHYFSE